MKRDIEDREKENKEIRSIHVCFRWHVRLHISRKY